MWHSGHSGLTEGVQAHIFGWCSQGNRLLFLTAFFACAALLEAGCRCQWCTLAASLWRAFSLLKMLGHFHLVFAILRGSERSCKVFEHGGKARVRAQGSGHLETVRCRTPSRPLVTLACVCAMSPLCSGFSTTAKRVALGGDFLESCCPGSTPGPARGRFQLVRTGADATSCIRPCQIDPLGSLGSDKI